MREALALTILAPASLVAETFHVVSKHWKSRNHAPGFLSFLECEVIPVSRHSHTHAERWEQIPQAPILD